MKMAKIDKLFDQLLKQKGSDLHLLQGEYPKMRIHGSLVKIEGTSILDECGIQELLQEICGKMDWQDYLSTKDLDWAYQYGTRARFRANYYYQHTGMAAVFRTIPTEVLSLDDLSLPPIMKIFAKQRNGLILVTGPTGSGKSTTLAAILNEINEDESRYILTIEEPVEFVHQNKKSIFCQREVGRDVHSFADALRSASRLDCDVILVGEMRDYETISLALSAASMGKLVLGTLHTNSAIKTVDRIIDVFPHAEQWKARNMLSSALYGICAQILLKRSDKPGRIAANEILINTQGISTSIREANISNIRNAIQSGHQLGMQLMDDAIEQHLKEGKIDVHEAYQKAHSKDRFHIFKEQKTAEEESD